MKQYLQNILAATFFVAALTLSSAQAQELPGFDEKKFGELIEKEAGEKGRLELTPQKVRDLLKKAGAEASAVDAFSDAEIIQVMRFLMRGMRSGGVPLTREDSEALNKQFMALLDGHQPAIKEARKSIAGLYNGSELLCFGTVVDGRGFLLTKASEIDAAGDKLHCKVGDNKHVARRVQTWKNHDLALLHVEAKNLPAVQWHAGELPAVGAFLTTPGIEDGKPIAIGMLGVLPRSLSNKDRGFLGIGVGEADNGVKVERVFPNLPAGKAGIETNDVVVKLNGKAPGTVAEFIDKVSRLKPGDKIKLEIKRGEEAKHFEVELAERPKENRMESPRFRRMNQMGGSLSEFRDGFPNVFQHDMPLEANQMGGPIVDLQGNVLGINIARAGRIKTFGIPGKQILDLMTPLDLTQLAGSKPEVAATDKPEAKPNPAASADNNPEKKDPAVLKADLDAALKAIERAQKALKEAEEAARKASRALQEANK